MAAQDGDFSSPYTTEDEGRPPTKRARKSNPSVIKWRDVEELGIVQPFEDFARYLWKIMARVQDTLTDSCDENSLSHFVYCLNCFNTKIEKDNKEFAILCSSLFFSHLAEHLEDYYVKVFPVIKANPNDRRSNRRSDYSLVRLNNQRTVIVCEVMFGITQELGALSQEFAQLFLEVFYVIRTDREKNRDYKHLIAILADHLIWHIMVLDISSKPYSIISYVCVTNESLTIGKVCVYLRTLITNLQ